MRLGGSAPRGAFSSSTGGAPAQEEKDSESGLRQDYGQARRSIAEAAASAGAREREVGPREQQEEEAMKRALCFPRVPG